MAGNCLEIKADVGDAIGEDNVFALLDPIFTKLELDRTRQESKRLALDGDLLAKDLERYRNLLAKEFVSQAEFDDYQNRFNTNEAQKTAVKVEEEILEERLKRFTIKAPAGWLVMERMLEPGEWVQQGMVVARVGDYRKLYVSMALDEDALNYVNDQTELSVYLPGRDKKIAARVARISPAFDPQTRKTLVDLEIDGAAAGFRGGVRVELSISLESGQNEVLVAETALQRRYDDYFITLKGGKQVSVRLLGSADNGYLRVRGDLKPGDRVELEARK